MMSVPFDAIFNVFLNEVAGYDMMFPNEWEGPLDCTPVCGSPCVLDSEAISCLTHGCVSKCIC